MAPGRGVLTQFACMLFGVFVKRAIMKWMYGWVLTGLILAGCSSKVYVLRSEAANMAKYKTYRWIDTKGQENGEEIRRSAFAEISIRNSVREVLEGEGWKEAKESPDVLLSYDILVERTSEEQAVPANAQPFTRLYYNPYLRRWGRIQYPAQFVGYDTHAGSANEATLTLTMMDARTDEALWQGWTTERSTTIRLSEEELQKTVRKILDKLGAQ